MTFRKLECYSLVRICVAFTNFVFMVPTLALVSITATLNYFHKTEILDFYQQQTISELNYAINATGLGSEGFYSNADLITLLSSFLLVLMICGAIVMVISVIGCLGSCCKMKGMIVLYLILVVLCLIVEILMAVLIYLTGSSGVLDENMGKSFLATLNRYEGLAGNTIDTFGWNFVMRRYACCGLYGEDDFTATDSWNGTLVLGGVTYNLIRPLACCTKLPETKDFTCATRSETNVANYRSEGCYDAVWDASVKNTYVGILPFVTGMIIQIGLVVCSCFLSGQKREHSKTKVDVMVENRSPAFRKY